MTLLRTLGALKTLGAVRTLGALGLVGFAALHTPAMAAEGLGWYGGLGLGQSRAGIHDDRISDQLARSGLVMDSIDEDARDFGFRVFGGWQFHPNLAFEAGYFNLGEFGFTANTTPAGTYSGNAKFQGLNADVVGFLPITDQFSLLGRVGMTYVETRGEFSGTGAVSVTDTRPRNNETSVKFGVGAQYAFTDALALRAEWERYPVKDAVGNKGDIDMLLVGLVYSFGGRNATAASTQSRYVEPAPAPAPVTQAPPVTPAPAPVTAAPAAAAAAAPEPAQAAVAAAPVQSQAGSAAAVPDPVVIVVPVAARTQRYCSILDLQFEINQTSVQRETEEKLDKVVTFMRKYPETTAVIEGHTDEVGSSADNLRLSKTRAESVVTYIANHGVSRGRLQTVGYGETRPIAAPNTEIGRRMNRRINAIIACATDIEGIEPIPARITMALDMEFDTNRAEVRPEYRNELRKLADFMKANPRVTATVEGHSSNQQGTPAKAMQLSQRRAESVVNALVNTYGISRSRLSATGYGETRRFAYNTSAEGRQENRRVNVILDFPS